MIKVSNYKKNKRNINKKFILDYLKNNSCVACGESDVVVLEFDHIKDKTYNISHMVGSCKKIQDIILEIQKCQVLCSNCHRRKTAKEFNWYKFSNN